jgi:hypothetical protein
MQAGRGGQNGDRGVEAKNSCAADTNVYVGRVRGYGDDASTDGRLLRRTRRAGLADTPAQGRGTGT